MNDLGITIHFNTEAEEGLLRIQLRVEADGIYFWNDKARPLKKATFAFDGKSGVRVRGGKFIRSVTTALSSFSPSLA